MENKELLLKVLCDGLPYGVKVHCESNLGDNILQYELNLTIRDSLYDCICWHGNMKPYLRDIEDMTDEEIDILLYEYHICNDGNCIFPTSNCSFDDMKMAFEWLNKKHFNWRGLSKDEYIRVTKENDPYKE